MEVPTEQVRREPRDPRDDQAWATTAMRGLVDRVFDGGGGGGGGVGVGVGGGGAVPARLTADLVPRGLDRRRFLSVGGAGVASAAVLASCRDDGGGEGDDGDARQQDIVILRTASSIERLAVAVYETALGSGLLTEPSLAEIAHLFADHHREHSEVFEGATTALGGVPFTQPNPAVLAQLQTRIDGLTSQKAAVQLARDVEALAAATYYSSVGTFADHALDQATVSAAGVEARHVTILSTVLVLAFATPTDQYPTRGFQTGDGAVVAGRGVS